jgi:hypothetical protein
MHRIPAYRAAVIFSRDGQFPLPWGRSVHWCHICDWGLCCNPSHIFPGSPSDNGQDRRGKTTIRQYALQPVALPDGRILTWQNSPLLGPKRYFDL